MDKSKDKNLSYQNDAHIEQQFSLWPFLIIFLVPRLCLIFSFPGSAWERNSWRLRLHLVAEPQRLRYEAEPRNERIYQGLILQTVS